MIFITLGVE